jgi:hypothetical protein
MGFQAASFLGESAESRFDLGSQRTGDLGLVQVLLIISTVILGKSCPFPCCCIICRTSMLDLMTSSQLESVALIFHLYFLIFPLNPSTFS